MSKRRSNANFEMTPGSKQSRKSEAFLDGCFASKQTSKSPFMKAKFNPDRIPIRPEDGFTMKSKN